jgi:hypothetical protein
MIGKVLDIPNNISNLPSFAEASEGKPSPLFQQRGEFRIFLIRIIYPPLQERGIKGDFYRFSKNIWDTLK